MNNTPAKPRRYAGLDILKTICAFLVVAIHARFPGDFGSYTVAVARVAVPVFLMITGFFYKGTQERGREKKQIVKILKLVVWSSVIFFVMLLGFNAAAGKAGQYIRETFTLKKLYEFVVFNASMFSDHLWYLGAILYVLLIVWGLFKAFPNGAKKILYIVTPLLLAGDLLLGKYSLVFFNREFPYLCTFGANIHAMLNNSFMLDSTIGEHARKRIEKLVEIYHQENSDQKKNDFLIHQQEFAYLSEHIGDEYLSKTVKRMFNEMMMEYQPQTGIAEQIKWYELKIKELKEKQLKDD